MRGLQVSFFMRGLQIISWKNLKNQERRLESCIFITILMIHVTDVMDRAGACLKSVLCIGVDKDHRASNRVLILYQTCTTIGLN